MFELKDVEENLTGTIKISSDSSGFALLQRHKNLKQSVLITPEDAPIILAELASYVEYLSEANKVKNCEVRWCETGEPGKVSVCEIIGDGAFTVLICEACARKIGVTDGCYLPNPSTVKKAVTSESNSDNRSRGCENFNVIDK